MPQSKLTARYRRIERVSGQAANNMQLALAYENHGQYCNVHEHAFKYSLDPDVVQLRRRSMFAAYRAAWREHMGL